MKRTALITLIALLFVSILSNVPTVAADVSEWHINAGGADFTASNGTLFVANKTYTAGDFGYTGSIRDFSFTNPIANTDDDLLYQKLISNISITYLSDMPNGDYDVTLYFMEPWQEAVGERIFDVSIEGVVVLDDYDIYATVGARYTAVTETIPVTLTDGQLTIALNRVSRYAILSAISVESAGVVTPVPEITVSPTSLAFGDVVNGTDSDLTVSITNDGTADLSVSSLTPTGTGFSVVSPTAPLTIIPGNSENVTVRFSPTATGAYSGSLDIASDDTDEPVVSVALSGNGVEAPPNEPDISVSPASVDFGLVITGGSGDQVVTINNTGLQTLTVSDLSTDNGVFTIVSPSTPFDVLAAGSQDITLRFSPSVDGVENGNLTITSNDPDENPVIVSLTGEGGSTPAVAYHINSGGPAFTDSTGASFVADKAYVAGDFGHSGKSRTFTFTNAIANTTDDALYQDIRANNKFSYLFDLDNGDYDVTLYFMEPWQSAAGERLFDVTMEGVVVLNDYDIFVAAGGKYTAVTETIPVTVSDGQLTIAFDRVNRMAMVAAISVVGEGTVTPPTDPDISVSPTSVAFGQVTIGNTSDKIVTVSNVGGQTLTVNSMTSSNSVFTIVSPATPFNVSPAGAQVVTVRYTPTAQTTSNGNLTINSNDPDEASVVVTLSGEGITSNPTTTYTNVTSAAGLANSHNINTGICLPTNNPPIGNGAAWADYDGDGDVDVYVTNQNGANWLYSNDGDGTFTNMAAAAGVSASSQTSTGTVFVDYDNDGDQDLFVGGHGGNIVYRNNGNSTFTDVTSSSGLTDGGRVLTAGWADFNNDGFLDVYLAKHKLCSGNDQQEDKLFVNDGDGTFTDVTTAYLCNGVPQCANVMGLGFVPGWLDYDNDGDMDIFLVNDDISGGYQPTKLFRNDGSDGSGGWDFTEVSVAANASYSLNGMGLGVGDYDNNGSLDLAFSNMGAGVLLSNDGDGTFTDQSSNTIVGAVTAGGVTWGTAFFDHDNDGDLDLYYTNGSLGGGGLPNYFFDNNGAGSFTDASAATGLNDGGKARALAIADFNDDGFIDVLVLNYGEVPALLENQGNSNNWLSITVEGTESNRDAIGARLTLTTGGVSQIREINSGPSHGGGDQRLALFGMGSNSTGTLVIDWPNGVTQNLGTVTAGQKLHFTEPSSTPSGTTYEDVTAVTGITAVDTLPASGCGVPAGNGIAWADYDNDGDVDAYIANHNGANFLYRNDGDTDSDNLPNFTNAAAAAGVQLSAKTSMSAVFIDYDNDGDQDLYVTNDAGNTLFKNQLIETAGATFTDVTATAGVTDTGRAVTSAWADFNNDSFLDFYVAKHMPCSLDNADNLYMNNGDGTFTEVTSYLCGGSASCAQVEGLGFSPAFLDYDNDGDLDLHLVNDDIGGNNYPNVLWRNDGSDGSGGWIFTDVSVAAGANISLNGMGQGVGDYNNDGWLDIAYSNGAPGRLLENNGDGTFTEVSGPSNISTIINEVTWGTVFFDYDNDGDQDLYFVAGEVAAQTTDVRNYLLSNNGNSTFADVSAASGLDEPGRGRSASIVDIDNDGFVDVMVGNYGGTYKLFHNGSIAQGNNSHWLTITVEGTESNRDGIGTRIAVTSGGVTQIREINSGPTHGGGDYRAGFFGLGANTTATLIVTWPNGVVEDLGSVTVDQAMHLIEPSSVPATPDIDAPVSLSFGDVETGTQRDKLVTVSNLGTADLTITSLTTTDGQFTVIGPTTPAVVAAGGSVNVTVRLTPATDGLKTADLTIVSDDPDEGSITVALSGTGVTAASTTFVDVINTAGIDPTHTLGGICNPPIGAGSAWADFDNDGDIDAYITDHGAANNLYRNNGDTDSDGVPNFTDVAATYGLEDAAGVGHATNFIDYDNDGDQDLYVSNWGSSTLYQNQLIETGSVAFTNVTTAAGLLDDGRVVTAAWADFDNDGNLDVYLAKHAYCGGTDPRREDKLYHSNGDGTFTDATSWLCTGCDAINSALGFSAGWLDYDNDGDLDMYVVNDVLQGDGSGGSENYHNVMWRNDGSDGSGGWLFTETSTPAGVDKAVNGMGLGIGDYDNDGDYDIAFSDIGASTLYSNNGNGTFTDVSGPTNAGTGSLTWATAFFDYNNDGWLDLYYASGLVGVGGSTPDIFLENNGAGIFSDISVPSGLNNDGRGRHAAMVDFDKDGLVDLFVGNYGTPAALYQNRADVQGNSNNWLFVTVEGTDSNRDGIGTKLTLTAGGITQIRTINSGPTHGGGDYRAAYFGLGTATSGTLTIEWPNGEVEVISISSGNINQYRHEVEPSSTPPPTTTYSDVTSQTGMAPSVTQHTTVCDKPPMGSGSAWGDYDNDGDVDVYMTNHGGANYLYRNDGDTDSDGLPNFTNVASSLGVDNAALLSLSAVFIDYDNDGDQDLYVSNWDGNSLFENQLIETGSVSFVDVAAAAGVVDAGRAITTGWADFNNDGWLDLYVAKHRRCAGDPQAEDHLYESNGDGTFTNVSSYLCGGASTCAQLTGLAFTPGWFDYDNDGDQDLYLVNDDIGGSQYPNVLWRNDGSDGLGGWTFTDVSTASGLDVSLNGMGLGVGDYDNDGFFDVAFSNIAPGRLMHNNGDGTFSDVSGASGVTGTTTAGTWGTAFFDYDNDADLDLYFVSGGVGSQTVDHRNFMMSNDGNGTSFTDISAASGLDDPGWGRSASMVDFDGDGWVDILVGNYLDGYYLYHNNSTDQGNTNNWLTITVEGTESNRDGIGTRLILTAGGVTQIREISSGPTHGGGDYRAAYFGLGGNASGSLTIQWPNGVVQSIGTVTAGQSLHYVEPSSTPPPATTFVDVAGQMGMSLTHTLSATVCAGPPLGTGSAWADYDNDGDIDVFITNNGAANWLYRNDGDTNSDGLPNYTNVAVAMGVDDPAGVAASAVFIDYDNDGDQDLYVTNWDDGTQAHGNVLYENQLIETGTVAFTDVTATAGLADDGRAITSGWADFDQDGFLDVYLAKHTACGSNPAALLQDHLYHNNGDGTFTDVSHYLCTSTGGTLPCPTDIEGRGFMPGWFDMDNDGDQDLYLVNDWNASTNTNRLWRNDGTDGSGGWNFVEISAAANVRPAEVNGMGLAIGDPNNDGWMDLAFSDVGLAWLYLNDQDGTFTDVSGTAGVPAGVTWGTVFFDYDNDGWEDLFYGGGSIHDPVNNPEDVMLWNRGSQGSPAVFDNVSAATGLNHNGRARGTSMVDFDQDGFVDLVVGNYGQDYRVYRNYGAAQGNTNHWLTVTLEGTVSNRDAIGARLTLVTASGTQIREINSGWQHGGGSHKAAYFGLGSDTSGTLTIRWPDGTTQVIGAVTGDQALHFVEPTGP